MCIKSNEIELWIDKHSLELLNRAFFFLSNRQDAEDNVQEVFIAACNSYDSFQKKSSPLTWLKGLQDNKIADFYRNKYKHIGVISTDHFFKESGYWKGDDILNEWDTSELHLLDDNQFNQTFENCLEALPLGWKIPIKLYYLHEKKTKEVCKETNITKENLWKILQRARLQLRECLELKWFNN